MVQKKLCRGGEEVVQGKCRAAAEQEQSMVCNRACCAGSAEVQRCRGAGGAGAVEIMLQRCCRGAGAAKVLMGCCRRVAGMLQSQCRGAAEVQQFRGSEV